MLKNKITIMFMLVIVCLLLNGVKNDDEYIEEEKPRKADEVIKNEYEYEQIIEAELASNSEPKEDHIINEEMSVITAEEEATVVEIKEENKVTNIPKEDDNNKEMDKNYNDNSNTDVNNNNSDKKDINDEYESTFKNQQSNQQQIEENIYQDNETQNINHVFRPFHVQNEKLNMIITRMELFVIKIHSQINIYIKHPYDLLCFFIFGYVIASLFFGKSSRITIQKYKQETDTNIFTLDKVNIIIHKLIIFFFIESTRVINKVAETKDNKYK
jgi:hypothetical protein